MNEPSLVVQLFRFTHPDGSSKDWAIRYDTAGVELYFGKTGKRLQVRTVPVTRCRNHSPALEAEQRMTEQRRQGYQPVGSYVLDRGNRRRLTSVSADPPVDETPAEATPRAWYWERIRRRAEPVLPRNALLRQGEAILAVLKRHRLIQAWTTQWQLDEWTSPWLLRVKIDRHAQWAFGFAEAYRNTPTADGQPLLDADGCGRGMIADPPPVAVLLFLLGLARCDPDLIIADEDGQVVARVPDHVTVAVEVLEELGLKSQPIAKLLNSGQGQSWFV
jgi:hypothetical protein